MLKPADVKRLRDTLTPLTFNIDQDQKLCQNALVKQYLNHYKINFPQSIDNVRHGFGSFEAAGFTLACHYWLPAFPKGTLFIFHGYLDHVGLFNHLIRFSLQNEYAVVAYDLPGMGLSSGDIANIDSFDQYHQCMEKCLQLFKGCAPKPWFGVGQSTGATALIQQALSSGLEPFSKIALLAPLIRSYGWKRSRWTYTFGRFFIRSIPRVFVENTHDKEFLKFIKKDDPMQPRRLPTRWVGAMKTWIDAVEKYPAQPLPLLIVQGSEDTTVDADYNIAVLKEKFPKAIVKEIPQGKHHLVAESAPYRAQVFAAIKSYLEK
jgi:lysophospholipase